ncbi:MAG TPA: hypothetical protein ENK28_01945 [Aliiroseovarius sp.]|nr:hypothetical protein [Aliiroseovarius sp.]
MRLAAARLIAAGFGLAVTLTSAFAQTPEAPDNRAFSATAVQTLPDGSEQTGRIAKSGQNMRIEMQVNGLTSIQIMRGAEGVAFLVNPQTKTFAEIRDPSIARAVSGASNPCPSAAEMQATGVVCELNGDGRVSGIVTQRWEIRAPNSDGVTVVQWDTGRRRALAQTWPDGTSLTMEFQAMQEIEGRQVEYWTSALQIPDQPASLGAWWFDAKLRVILREEMPGGVSRVLKDIKVGPVDPAEFLPPQGYQLVQPQQAGTGQ